MSSSISDPSIAAAQPSVEGSAGQPNPSPDGARAPFASHRSLAELSDYVHVLPGRVRIRVREIHRAPDRARHLEATLESLPAVSSVSANSLTGMVLVLFDASRLTPEDVGEHLRAQGFLRRRAAPRPAADRTRRTCQQCGASEPLGPASLSALMPVELDAQWILRKAAACAASNLVEFAVKRAFLALI